MNAATRHAVAPPTTNNRLPTTGELAFTGLGNGRLVWVRLLLLLGVALPRLARRR